jgi:hypothetical protein
MISKILQFLWYTFWKKITCLNKPIGKPICEYGIKRVLNYLKSTYDVISNFKYAVNHEITYLINQFKFIDKDHSILDA